MSGEHLAEFTSDEQQEAHLAALRTEAAMLEQNALAERNPAERRRDFERRHAEVEAEISRIGGEEPKERTRGAARQTRPRGAEAETR